MANASKHHMGPATQGKGSGTGAMTPESVADPLLGENQVLSNRDKAQMHTDERGLDSRAVKNEQRQDNVHNRQTPNTAPVTNTSSVSAPNSTTSGADSSLESRRGGAGALARPDPSADER